jgi:hypothetical protein
MIEGKKHMKMKAKFNYLVLTGLALACFALSPQARAVCQEGCLTNQNTVLGEDALINTTGTENTAVGFNALFSNTGGFANTAEGSRALFSNTTGSLNTAIGDGALLSNTTGISNTAIGGAALGSNTTGFSNTAIGNVALFKNTTGTANTANGALALEHNTTGSDNTATGSAALNSSTGFRNTATGRAALSTNTTGNDNTAMGFNALLNNTTGIKNIALGFRAGSLLTTGDDNIDIGNPGQPGESSTIRIGRVQDHTATFLVGLSGATVPTGVAVIVDADGHLGTTTSSARFKEEIKPMDEASEAILALKPVTFHYKRDLDPKGVPQFGLVAEDVEKVNPALVARDAEGKVFTVRYEAVNAMLLNEFLKEHRKNEQQEATISQLKTELAQQQKEIKALSAQIQKVSAQVATGRVRPTGGLEASKFATGRIRPGGPAPQTVLNNQ